MLRRRLPSRAPERAPVNPCDWAEMVAIQFDGRGLSFGAHECMCGNCGRLFTRWDDLKQHTGRVVIPVQVDPNMPPGMVVVATGVKP